MFKISLKNEKCSADLFLLWQSSVTNALPLTISINVYCADFSHHQTSPPKYHTVVWAVNDTEQWSRILNISQHQHIWTHHLLANINTMQRNYQEINNNNNLQNCQYQPHRSNITYKIKLCPMATQTLCSDINFSSQHQRSNMSTVIELTHRVREKRCHFIFACNSAKC